MTIMITNLNESPQFRHYSDSMSCQRIISDEFFDDHCTEEAHRLRTKVSIRVSKIVGLNGESEEPDADIVALADDA